jgi:site-specific DNA-methyltransferase (adenine-specific)
MPQHFLRDRVALHCGDCREVVKALREGSIDAVVTDPPYSLVSISKRYTTLSDRDFRVARADPYRRTSAGFMGQKWDTGEVAFDPMFWAEVRRVLKPGAHMLAMGGTRTWHRLACAIEDAGFEIRDTIMWIYGSGFPKSLDVSKAIDRAAGVEREKIRIDASKLRNPPNLVGGAVKGDDRPWRLKAIECDYHEHNGDIPATDAARQWDGWGTALKPAVEPIVLARKPLGEGTVAANVLAHGTGAINVDGCRIAGDIRWSTNGGMAKKANPIYGAFANAEVERIETTLGRWPANLIHDGSPEVVAAFPDAGGGFGTRGGNDSLTSFGCANGSMAVVGYGDSGSAARFFYSAKADADERIGSSHPTVKPLDLIQYLIRLITPPGGVVLDPFAGTGTAGEAAYREGMRAILIEREAEYQDDIRRRMALVLAGPDERARESVKARGLPVDYGPLFEDR